ncbi:inositol monophosphatase family protein [Roseibium sp. SCP14]|uniref:inositol monophosphatase family protein n=1 Tax=Roseibium sp. SCP14 TaxID=3141375 RepID=UPI003337694B
MNDIEARLGLARNIAVEAGKIAQRHRQQGLTIDQKAEADFVTDADLAVEKFLVERIQRSFPDDAIFAEETTKQVGDGGVWVLDPIDGTTNFSSGMDLWGISIGWMKGNRREFGVIFAPDRRELFWARRGFGAFLGDTPLNVTALARAPSTIVLGKAPSSPVDQYLGYIDQCYGAGLDYRRLGAATMCLTHVARGWSGAYLEGHVNSWDCAAGLVICEEAGCIISEETANMDLVRGGPVMVAHPEIYPLFQGR